MKKIFLIMLLSLGMLSGAMAHSDGTDSNNCHHNTKTGGYQTTPIQ
jgi:uncharacterized protein YdeI (BOF family)